jgi:hypothetical protein
MPTPHWPSLSRAQAPAFLHALSNQLQQNPSNVHNNFLVFATFSPALYFFSLARESVGF